ncbi:MAG TPA: hypothetical protein VKT77_01900 [Chthonomonadaceae bacterium]|nr:hypothetical protein [Chthonomonadaceae bacterium]
MDTIEGTRTTSAAEQLGLTDPLLDALIGAWRVDRAIGTRRVQNDARVAWTLAHQFVQIHMIDVASPPQYEALVHIGGDGHGGYVAYWLDTFGGPFSARGVGTRDGDSFIFAFQDADGSLRNTFTRDPAADTWRSLIEQQRAGGPWSVFCEDRWVRR